MTALWESAPEGGWERVLLKLSGEAFSGGTGLGVDPDVVASIAAQIAEVVPDGRQVAQVDRWRQLLPGRPTVRAGHADSRPGRPAWACSAR
ncbi:MAG: hypothetical protein U0R27_05795 [Candidatus Nanopelagicales bacterium]